MGVALNIVSDLPTRLPRPKALPYSVSEENYYFAVRAWATGRSDKEVLSYLNLPPRALNRLVDTREWADVVQLVRQEYADQEIIALTRLHSMSLKIVADALERGDPYVDFKTGEVRYKRLTGKDAASIAATLGEQRHIAEKRLAGLPTEDDDIRNELLEIAHALRAHRAKDISHATNITPDARPTGARPAIFSTNPEHETTDPG